MEAALGLFNYEDGSKLKKMNKTNLYLRLDACSVLKGRVYFPLNCELWLCDVFSAKSTSQVRGGLVRAFFYTITSLTSQVGPRNVPGFKAGTALIGQ